MFAIGLLAIFVIIPIVAPIWLFCGWYAGVVQKRNRYHERQKEIAEATGVKTLSKSSTTLINFILGPFALLFMAAVPDTKNCLYCKEFILKNACTCRSCGRVQR